MNPLLPSKLQCCLCRFRTIDGPTFCRHYDRKHSGAVHIGCWCIDCGLIFLNSISYIDHVPSCTKRKVIWHPCGIPDCSFGHLDINDLLLHVYKQHANLKYIKAKCRNCNTIFSTVFMWLHHLQNECIVPYLQDSNSTSSVTTNNVSVPEENPQDFVAGSSISTSTVNPEATESNTDSRVVPVTDSQSNTSLPTSLQTIQNRENVPKSDANLLGRSVAVLDEHCTVSQAIENNQQYIFKTWEEWWEKWLSLKNIPSMDSINQWSHFYKCMSFECKFSTVSAEDFHAHLLSEHKNESMRCSFCFITKPSPVSLIVHTHSHASQLFQCPRCFYKACQPAHVILHQQLFHKKMTLQKVWRCPKPAPLSFTQTDNSLPYDVKLYMCNDCPFQTRNTHQFELHQATHPLKHCFECKEVTTSFNQLLEHLQKHDIFDFHCTFCPFGANKPYHVFEHICINHPEKPLKQVSRSEIEIEGNHINCNVIKKTSVHTGPENTNKQDTTFISASAPNKLDKPLKQISQSNVDKSLKEVSQSENETGKTHNLVEETFVESISETSEEQTPGLTSVLPLNQVSQSDVDKSLKEVTQSKTGETNNLVKKTFVELISKTSEEQTPASASVSSSHVLPEPSTIFPMMTRPKNDVISSDQTSALLPAPNSGATDSVSASAFLCALCGVPQCSILDLKIHLIKHHKLLKLLKCMQCMKTFESLDSLVAHTKTVHEGNSEMDYNTVKLDSPDLQLADMLTLTRTTPLSYLCVFCGYKDSNKDEMIDHLCEKILYLRYTCQICEFQSCGKKELDQHIIDTHGASCLILRNINTRDVRDTWISNYLNSQEAVASSSLLTCLSPSKCNPNMKKSSCPMCQKVIIGKQRLINHLCDHLQYKPYACAVCHLLFDSQMDVTEHAFLHHKDADSRFVYFPSTIIDKFINMLVFGKDKLYWPVIFCQYCSYNDFFLFNVFKHLNEQHPDLKLSFVKVSKQRTPDVDLNKSAAKENDNSIVLLHCFDDKCGFNTSELTQLQTHWKCQHKNQNNSSENVDKNKVKHHVRSEVQPEGNLEWKVKTPKTNFSCNVCKAGPFSMKKLKFHMKEKHHSSHRSERKGTSNDERALGSTGPKIPFKTNSVLTKNVDKAVRGSTDSTVPGKDISALTDMFEKTANMTLGVSKTAEPSCNENIDNSPPYKRIRLDSSKNNTKVDENIHGPIDTTINTSTIPSGINSSFTKIVEKSADATFRTSTLPLKDKDTTIKTSTIPSGINLSFTKNVEKSADAIFRTSTLPLKDNSPLNEIEKSGTIPLRDPEMGEPSCSSDNVGNSSPPKKIRLDSCTETAEVKEKKNYVSHYGRKPIPIDFDNIFLRVTVPEDGLQVRVPLRTFEDLWFEKSFHVKLEDGLSSYR